MLVGTHYVVVAKGKVVNNVGTLTTPQDVQDFIDRFMKDQDEETRNEYMNGEQIIAIYTVTNARSNAVGDLRIREETTCDGSAPKLYQVVKNDPEGNHIWTAMVDHKMNQFKNEGDAWAYVGQQLSMGEVTGQEISDKQVIVEPIPTAGVTVTYKIGFANVTKIKEVKEGEPLPHTPASEVDGYKVMEWGIPLPKPTSLHELKCLELDLKIAATIELRKAVNDVERMISLNREIEDYQKQFKTYAKELMSNGSEVVDLINDMVSAFMKAKTK